jgi:hypothetical protein
MEDRRACEFFLVRYVPDRVKNEFVNIGVLLREDGRADDTLVRFTRDWSRVRCVDPEADISMLEGLEEEVRRLLGTRGAAAMKMIEDSFSHDVQVTGGKGYLAESLPAGVEELMRMYVEPPKREAGTRKSGRQAIHAKMRNQFDRVEVWDLMRKRIAAADYTRPGDPLRIDCGYRPNGGCGCFTRSRSRAI